MNPAKLQFPYVFGGSFKPFDNTFFFSNDYEVAYGGVEHRCYDFWGNPSL